MAYTLRCTAADTKLTDVKGLMINRFEDAWL